MVRGWVFFAFEQRFQMEMWFIKLHCEAIVVIHVSKCFQKDYNGQMICIGYHCDVSCCVTCIIFYQLFELVTINDYRPAVTFTVFQIKIFTSEHIEPLMNCTLSYDTFSINDTSSCCLYSLYLIFLYFYFLK